MTKDQEDQLLDDPKPAQSYAGEAAGLRRVDSMCDGATNATTGAKKEPTWEEIGRLTEELRASQEREKRLREAMEVSRQALWISKLMVRNEIWNDEIAGRHSNAWPDLLTGCVSGGGIEAALLQADAALAETQPTGTNAPQEPENPAAGL